MTPQVLLDALRQLIREQPGLDGRGNYGSAQHEWLGRASSLINEWDRTQAIGFRVAARSMASNLNRQMNCGAVLTTIHEAIASIENELPSQPGQVFGPGAVYDFFKALNELVESAASSLLIVDPYLDKCVFDGYLTNARRAINIRLLAAKHADIVKVAAQAFTAQHGGHLSVRKSDKLHDRVIFIDGKQCWVLGTSINSAATKKPTYLAPLSDDVFPQKLKIYEDLWKTAAAIYPDDPPNTP